MVFLRIRGDRCSKSLLRSPPCLHNEWPTWDERSLGNEYKNDDAAGADRFRGNVGMNFASLCCQIKDVVLNVTSWNPARDGYDQIIRYIDLSSVNQDTKTIHLNEPVVARESPSRARQLVQTGDVLVSTVRPNLNGVAIIDSSLDGATASTGFCVLRPDEEKLDRAYLFHWVKTSEFILDMVRKATGASYPAVSDRIVLESKIPLPPIAEQKRIAAILDKAEELRGLRRKALGELDAIVQSVFLEMFGDPITNPKSLLTTTLLQVSRRITDGTHQPPKWASHGIPFLFVSNIVDGQINFETQKFISEETHTSLMKRCPVEIGDVLYTTVGSYGNAALVSTNRKFSFQRHIAHIKPKISKINPLFLASMLQSPGVRQQVDKTARGAAQKTVNLADLKELTIFLPQLALQQEFARRVEAIEQLKATHRESLAHLDALFASLQHRAFRGEL